MRHQACLPEMAVWPEQEQDERDCLLVATGKTRVFLQK
jgi:hypothetical protein